MRKSKKIEAQFKFGDELKSEESKKAVVFMLQSGINSQFWQFMLNILDLNIKETERIILEEDLNNIELVKEWKNKLYYQKMLRNYPEKLLDRFQSTKVKEDINKKLDPYD